MPSVGLSEGTRAYSRLKTEINRAGILERSLSFYWPLILLTFLGYGFSALAIFLLEHYLLLGLACVSFAVFSVQTAGLMHDSGHRAVFGSIRNNDILGYVCSTLLAMVFDNWKSRHNAHHAHPNEEDLDPDMEIPFIATSEDFYLRKGFLQRRLIKYQAFYYFPLGAIVGFSNRLGTITYFLNNRSSRNIWKLLLYICGIVLLFASPFIVFTPEKAVFVFVVVHVSTGIYLANCFAPNHKGMPVVNAPASFIEQQIITARNVRGGFLTDLVLVGLNRQVEHHLFPNCPRNKLRLLQPYVRQMCAELKLEYTEVGLIETNKILLGELSRVARASRISTAQEVAVSS